MLRWLRWLRGVREVVPPANYLKFYLEDGEIKIDFEFSSVGDLTMIADAVFNSKVKDSCLSLIAENISNAGRSDDAILFYRTVSDDYIKPTDFEL